MIMLKYLRWIKSVIENPEDVIKEEHEVVDSGIGQHSFWGSNEMDSVPIVDGCLFFDIDAVLGFDVPLFQQMFDRYAGDMYAAVTSDKDLMAGYSPRASDTLEWFYDRKNMVIEVSVDYTATPYPDMDWSD